jgi:hypothetical protein
LAPRVLISVTRGASAHKGERERRSGHWLIHSTIPRIALPVKPLDSLWGKKARRM